MEERERLEGVGDRRQSLRGRSLGRENGERLPVDQIGDVVVERFSLDALDAEIADAGKVGVMQTLEALELAAENARESLAVEELHRHELPLHAILGRPRRGAAPRAEPTLQRISPCQDSFRSIHDCSKVYHF